MIRAHEVAVDEMWVPVWPSCERLVRTRATKQGEGGASWVSESGVPRVSCAPSAAE